MTTMKHTFTFEEYGQRYGEKVAGWWVDGCYPFIGYDDEKLGILARALKPDGPNQQGTQMAIAELEVYE
jgi:hypothetical protein